MPRTTERFPLRLPIRYRPVGSLRWAHGTTENISGNGVLVRADVVPGLHAALDFRFPVEVGRHRCEVACRGAVIRTATDGHRKRAFAATIDVFTFVPPGE